MGNGFCTDQSSGSRQTVALRGLTTTSEQELSAHLARVGWLAFRMAMTMGFAESEAIRIADAARLHDVGKTRIPRDLLGRAGPLTPQEFYAVQRHSELGALLLIEAQRRDRIDMRLEIEVALYHHERWDGGGYPAGIAGDRIPIAARIVAVVDVYDALLTSRAYKRAWSDEDALGWIMEGSGSQFDPVCVSAFVLLHIGLPGNWQALAGPLSKPILRQGQSTWRAWHVASPANHSS